MPFTAVQFAVAVALTGVAAAALAQHGAPEYDRSGAPSPPPFHDALCGTCHLVPPVDHLDRATWIRHGLRSMAPWLGLSRPNYESMPDGDVLRRARLFPDVPALSEAQWGALMEYYAAAAPLTTPPPERDIEPGVGVPGFRVETWDVAPGPAFVTLLHIDPQGRRVFVGDGQHRSLRALGPAGEVQWEVRVPSGPVSMVRHRDQWLVTLIGRVFPSDEQAGELWSVDDMNVPRRLLAALRRPVHTTVADLDGDGRDDLVVSSFGNRMGDLSWHRCLANGSYEEQRLSEQPGHLGTVAVDWNRDGHPDLLAAHAQAWEGVTLYLNDGNGAFESRRLLAFPPTFGMSGFALADLNGDGSAELLVVNGDSGEFPTPPRAFHGIRIYEREADGDLAERAFVPMCGAYAVESGDWDGDGHIDLAAVAFFPEYGQSPVRSFLLLRNEGEWTFKAHALESHDARSGRWLVMDSGDLDGDGDVDLVLGSFTRGPPTVPIPDALIDAWRANGVDVMVLRNTRVE